MLGKLAELVVPDAVLRLLHGRGVNMKDWSVYLFLLCLAALIWAWRARKTRAAAVAAEGAKEIKCQFPGCGSYATVGAMYRVEQRDGGFQYHCRGHYTKPGE